MKIRSHHQHVAFALVITLALVVLVTIVVAALLANASLDRTSSSAYAQRYQAELAAQTGLEAAKEALFAVPTPGATPQTQNDSFIVTSAVDSNNVPYYYVGSAQPAKLPSTAYGSPSMQYFPLYSGGTVSAAIAMSTAGVAPSVTPAPTPSAIASQSFSASATAIPIYYPKLFPSPAPHASWQPYIRTQWQTAVAPSPAPIPTASPMQYRYTYWIEDLTGYVDANVAGNVDSPGTTHYRPLGYDPKEVALFSVFSSPSPSPSDVDSGTTYAKTLVANRPFTFTRLSTRLGTTAKSADDNICLTSLVANLAVDSEQNVIPFGMGYNNEGQLKTNLNKIVANVTSGAMTADNAIYNSGASNTSIVKTITDNLPKFATSRQGGLSSSPEGYLETIAANVIDYADGDSLPTVGTNGTTGKHYRGIELMPFVTEVYQMYYWEKDYYLNPTPVGSAAPTYYVDVRIRTYVQLWNMFSQDITKGVLTFNDIDKAGLQFGTGGPKTSFDKAVTVNDSKLTLDFSKSPPIGPGALKANQYAPVLACERVYTLDTGSTTKPLDTTGKKSAPIHIGDNGDPTKFDKHSSYDVQWNGVSCDRPGANALTATSTAATASPTPAIERDDCSLSQPADVTFVGTIPALRYSQSVSNPPFNLGDPRGSYYIQAKQFASKYVGNSSWGGQVYMKDLVEKSGWIAGESRVPGWSDGGHGSARGVVPSATPAALTDNPTTLSPFPTPEPSKAPARISNRSDGRIFSITELSYLYDPFQWDPFAATPTTAAAVDAGWQGTWSTKFKNFPTAIATDATYESHSTLRIGRPEHLSFDQPGTRASQLLDIFSAGDPSDSSAAGAVTDRLTTKGKININTARPEALRALAAGIRLGNVNSGDVDQAIQPSTVYGPSTGVAGDVFAQNIVARRQKQPFVSTSQLAALQGSKSEYFFGNADQWPSGGPTEWNDAAAEQYFAKIYNFATVRSRNFRVFVTGQYVDPNQNDPYTNKPPRVVATANKVYEVFLKPTRNSATGAITSQQVQVTYSADIQ